MINTEFDAMLGKHTAFWTRGMRDGPLLNVDRVSDLDAQTAFTPLGLFQLPLADGGVAQDGMAITPDMIDPRLLVDLDEFPTRHPRQQSHPAVVDGLFIRRAPVWKMPWVEAILGCPLVFGGETGSIWSQDYLDSPTQMDRIPSVEENGWLDKLTEYTGALVEHSEGRYQVTQCLMRGTVDLVAALLGYYQTCASISDHPFELHKLAEHCARVFIQVGRAQEAAIPQLDDGRCTSFGIWAPGTVVMTQADASSAMSAKDYEEFFFPYEVQICREFDYSTVHLHSGFLHTVDVFLSHEYPTAVQVALDTGSTPVTVHDLVPTFKKVLDHKPLLVMGVMTQLELDELLAELPHEGLYISALIQGD